MDCWSYTINHIPPFIFKDTRVISIPYTLDRDPCLKKKWAEEKQVQVEEQ